MGLLHNLTSAASKNTYRAKANPSQPAISLRESSTSSREAAMTYLYFYDTLEIVNRGINMLIDNASEINYKIEEKVGANKLSNIAFKSATVDRLLNYSPNPYQDLSSFRRQVIMDILLDGNAFILVDMTGMYLLPAANVTVVSSTTTYIDHYLYQTDGTKYYPYEIIHIKDNSHRSLFRGESRLKSALRTMKLMTSMRAFQDNFFENGAVPGLVIESPEPISTRLKERLKIEWKQAYNPKSGGRNPMILDSGMKLDNISNVNFKELDFEPSIEANEKKILKALGIPPVLVDSGNNANIRPNHRLYYLETVLPIVQKICSAYQAFFGFRCYEDTVGIPALQAELKDEAAYHTSLVNGGIFTTNEARIALGKNAIAGQDEIRVPQNIAGSAVDPSSGGKPSSGDNNTNG